MRLSVNAVIAALVLSCLSLSLPTHAAQGTGAAPRTGPWTPLFNGKDLTGWDVYLGPRMDAKGEKIPGTATGLNKDPERVFTVVAGKIHQRPPSTFRKTHAGTINPWQRFACGGTAHQAPQTSSPSTGRLGADRRSWHHSAPLRADGGCPGF